MTLAGMIPSQPADVCIHCGDLTEESKLDELHATLELLHAIEAPLKLVIAGNHDFTLDTLSFRKKVEEARPRLEPELVAKVYGEYGEAKSLLLDVKRDGIYLLDEGTHRFTLQNGAELTVYTSPYTIGVSNTAQIRDTCSASKKERTLWSPTGHHGASWIEHTRGSEQDVRTSLQLSPRRNRGCIVSATSTKAGGQRWLHGGKNSIRSPRT